MRSTHSSSSGDGDSSVPSVLGGLDMAAATVATELRSKFCNAKRETVETVARSQKEEEAQGKERK